MKVDAQTPPPDPGTYAGVYWERASDPFHFDAMPADMKPDTLVVTINGQFKGGLRLDGWMAIDWCENAVGFVADGTDIDGAASLYVIRTGPFGHECAYPDTPYGRERMKDHEGKDYRRAPTVEAKP